LIAASAETETVETLFRLDERDIPMAAYCIRFCTCAANSPFFLLIREAFPLKPPRASAEKALCCLGPVGEIATVSPALRKSGPLTTRSSPALVFW